MKRKRPLGPALALVALSAAGLLAVAGPAQGGPMDDGAPSGTIAFFTGGYCPAGWQPAMVVQGRLVVGVVDGANVGVTVGTPLTDQEDRQHQHTYTTSFTLPSDNVSAADGPNNSGAAAQQYMITGTTDMAASSLPFVQVQPCVKP